jgi:cellobiose phosphorylase
MADSGTLTEIVPVEFGGAVEKVPFVFEQNGTVVRIDTAEPDRTLHNMLYNPNYLTMLDQSNRGMAKHMSPAGRNCNIVQSDRFIYVRDAESGEYFSIGYAPVFKEYERYTCRAGLNVQIIENVTDGIEAVWRIYVPSGSDPVEVWDVRIRNVSNWPRRLQLFTYVPMNCDGEDLYCGELHRIAQYLPEEQAIFVCMDAPRYLDKVDLPWHNGFLAVNRKPDGWDASLSAVIGSHRTTRDPAVVEKGACTGSKAAMFSPVGTLQLNMELAPGATEDARFMIGACDAVPMLGKLRKKYLSSGSLDADVHFEALQKTELDRAAALQVSTPDEKLNEMINVWSPKQIDYGVVWTRWGFKGYRDIIQQCQGAVIQQPKAALEQLLKACAHQYESGFGLRGWHPIDDLRYADSSQWMIGAFYEYLAETGDFQTLKKTVPFFDQSEASVYEHLRRSLVRLHEDRGAHGLNLVFFGDWNDSLTGVCREGRGESIWLSMAFCRSCLLLAEIADYIGKADDAAEYRAWHKEMAEAVNKHAWDGQWYLCALDDNANPIGSQKNDEGKIFLNMQSWAQLGKVVSDDRWNQSWDSVHEMLDSGWGLMLNWPAYTKYVHNVGRLSSIRPGAAENASVYTHGNAFMLLALLERGMADEAYDLWQAVQPGNPERPVLNQPNVFFNGYYGPDSENRVGMGEHAWTTGSVPWMYQCVTEHMLGVRRTLDGLTIKPCLPSAWEEVSIRRVYRGTTYDIRISNSGKKAGAAVTSMTLDGAAYDAVRPLPVDGGTHTVLVVLAE